MTDLTDEAVALLPCPFCGGGAKAHIWENHTGDTYGGVECVNCPAEIAWAVHWHDDGSEEKAKAIAAWNSRTPEALAASPEVAKLVAEAEARGMERAAPTDPESAFNRADWFWRAMDPDDCGDSPEEAINRAMVGCFCVCEIASSYAGPTRYGFIAPVLDPAPPSPPRTPASRRGGQGQGTPQCWTVFG